MELHVPITKVEHWFRQDDCFAVPDPDIWMPLKKLLGIETDEFDKSIMTFEEKEGVYEKSDRHYFAEGIAPTLTSTSAGNEKIIIDEPSIIEDFYKSRDPRIYNDVAPTLRADRTGLKVSTALRIRKLTPKECFRLMGFDDVDFAKAEAVNSNTQLYKQAGNSIVVPVIEFLIEALFECGAFDKRVEEAPTVKHRTVEQPKKELFGFAALLSAEDELALKEFFGLRNIEYKAI